MRKPAARNKPTRAQLKSFPAPVGGWIANENLATPNARRADGSRVQGAAMLDNWFPTATGIRMRGGKQKYATLGSGDPVTSAFSYSSGANTKLFGATGTAIYDITTIADPEVSPAAIVAGQAGGAWVFMQFATAGGVFLVGVNGIDPLELYNGTTFFPITNQNVNALGFDGQTLPFTVGTTLTGGTSGATATIVNVIDNGTTGTLWIGNVTGGPFQNNEAITSPGGAAVADGVITQIATAITGVDTRDLSYVWAFKNRVFFIEKNSLSAWYMSQVDAIAGPAVELPLGGVFALGGSLLFGAVWSLDTGSGLSEQCVFVTTEGEVAIYQGTNPGDAAAWSKVGVYRIGRPLGAKAHIRAGGDLIIATDIGFIPLSQAIQRDVAVLSPSAVSYPIETAWNDYVARRASGGAWQCEVWPTKQMVMVAPPPVTGEADAMFPANARTGAWSRYTNWGGTCLETFQNRMFFGTVNGLIYEAEVTGSDDGDPYTAVCVPLFEDMRTPASLKTALLCRAAYLAPAAVDCRLSAQADFQIRLPVQPDATPSGDESVWGVAVWGESKWGESTEKSTFQAWDSVSGSGSTLAPAIQITSGKVAPPSVDLVRIDLTYDVGDMVT